MSWSGTVRCSYCGAEGHNRSGCPVLKENMEKRLEENPNDYYAKQYFEKKQRRTKRTCGYCKESGHNRKTCPEAKKDRDVFISQNQVARERALDWLKKSGIGAGTLIEYETYWNNKILGLVERIDWTRINSRSVGTNSEGTWVVTAQCLVTAPVSGASKRERATPHTVEVLGTIPHRLVTAQVPYAWLESKDEETLGEIDAELRESSMSYIRQYILNTESPPW